MSRFHLRITALTFGANFSDGYALGGIGIVLTVLTPAMGLSSLWQGILGSSMLVGVLVGSVVCGWLADRFGRRLVYQLDFIVIAVASAAQFFVDGPMWLLVLRLIIGFGVGADYALGPTMVTEFVPTRYRGGLLASLTVMWTVGYVAAFFIGSWLVNLSPDAWRWMLASGAIPALVVLLLRIGTPESPRWLIEKGRIEEARIVSARFLDGTLDIDKLASESSPAEPARYRDLFSVKHRKNTAFGIIFYNCQVIPYFAIYTFLPAILVLLGMEDGFSSGAILNIFLLFGGIAGLWAIAKIDRRPLTIYSFVIMAVTLTIVSVGTSWPMGVVVLAFAVFTFVMSGASNLDQVYPAELFPTRLRATGVGFLNGASRLGSAAGTFLLPVALSAFGLTATMLVLVAILVIGAVCSVLMAPETAHLSTEELGAH
ncbi:MFS transporter [Rhodococcus globerulus]|uniref:MFS transporter n=1 Tax=Rhodococcus globerulus TaxID=33008 RepID=A0ABU4C3U1_RHOGO|nr:MFS transporter [Rhodococcus globerulus]MDV6271038.1 MFS transporter [Rhodococcus globerulus]